MSVSKRKNRKRKERTTDDTTAVGNKNKRIKKTDVHENVTIDDFIHSEIDRIICDPTQTLSDSQINCAYRLSRCTDSANTEKDIEYERLNEYYKNPENGCSIS